MLRHNLIDATLLFWRFSAEQIYDQICKAKRTHVAPESVGALTRHMGTHTGYMRKGEDFVNPLTQLGIILDSSIIIYAIKILKFEEFYNAEIKLLHKSGGRFGDAIWVDRHPHRLNLPELSPENQSIIFFRHVYRNYTNYINVIVSCTVTNSIRPSS